MSRLNLILTNVCNKKCSFCFASKETNQKPQEMDFNMVKELIVSTGNIKPDSQFYIREIALLGGEPTIYSNITPLIDFVYQYNIAREKINKEPLMLFVISNFLYQNPLLSRSFYNYAKKFPITYLINVSELTIEQKEIVIHNMKNSKIYQQHLLISFTCSTLFDFSYYENILNTFYEEFFSKVPASLYNNYRIRVSVPNAAFGHNDGLNQIMKNKDVYLSQIENFIKWGIEKNIKTGVDCGLFCCLFNKDKEKLLYLAENLDEESFGCGNNKQNKIFSFYPNKTLRGCYCCSEYIYTKFDEINKETMLTAFKEINDKYEYFFNNAKPPTPCKKCKLYGNICLGPCMGYYDFNKNLQYLK